MPWSIVPDNELLDHEKRKRGSRAGPVGAYILCIAGGLVCLLLAAGIGVLLSIGG